MASKYLLPCFRTKANRTRREKDSECLMYRNELVEALERTKGKLEATWKAVDAIVSKACYQGFTEQLYDIIYTGGLLTKDGKIPQRGELKLRTSHCVFKCLDELNALRVYYQLIQRLRRRHKDLDAVFESYSERLLTLLCGFDVGSRRRLALLMALFLMDEQINPKILLSLGHKQASIEEGLALEFMLVLCGAIKKERGPNLMLSILKKSGLDGKIISYMPPMLRSDLYFQQVYQESDLTEIIKLQETRAGQELRRQLRQRLTDDIREKVPYVNVVMNLRQFQREHHMSDSEVIGIVWQTINSRLTTTNNLATKYKSGYSLEQTMRKLQIYSPLLNALCNTDSAQIALLLWLQEWCYEHHNLFKCFETLVVHLYKEGVINQDAIIRWYEVEHNDKGKVAFLEQMSRFIHWLHSDTDANCQVDYGTYLTNQRNNLYRSKPVYSDVGPSMKTKFTKYV